MRQGHNDEVSYSYYEVYYEVQEQTFTHMELPKMPTPFCQIYKDTIKLKQAHTKRKLGTYSL